MKEETTLGKSRSLSTPRNGLRVVTLVVAIHQFWFQLFS
jgi:hypothetical protein